MKTTAAEVEEKRCLRQTEGTTNLDGEETETIFYFDNSPELVWRVGWIRAFPTLLSLPSFVLVDFGGGSVLSCNNNSNNDGSNNEDDFVLWNDFAWRTVMQPAVDRALAASQRLRAIQERETVTAINNNDNASVAAKETLEQPTSNDNNNNNNKWENSLGYGEITPYTVFRVLAFLSQNCGWWLIPFPSSRRTTRTVKVVDLGSGNGLVLLATSLCCQDTMTQALGIEIVPRLHQQAVTLYTEVWKSFDPFSPSSSTTEADSGSRLLFDWKCADFTIEKECWTTTSSNTLRDSEPLEQQQLIVWIHATIFEPALLQEVERLVMDDDCRPGTIFCVVSRPLLGATTTAEASLLETLGELLLEMDWGPATVYIQRKKKKNEP